MSEQLLRAKFKVSCDSRNLSTSTKSAIIQINFVLVFYYLISTYIGVVLARENYLLENNRMIPHGPCATRNY